MPTPRQHNRLTDFQKGRIDALRPYFSHHEIACQLGIHQCTVSSFLKQLNEHESIENIPPPGRPCKTLISDDQYIVHTAELETRVPPAELHRDVNLNVSEQTIRRQLREAGIRKWKAVKHALLIQRHATNHLKWAKAHQHWAIDNWQKVAWSDECASTGDQG
jgi:hypothetical protein